MLIWIMSYFYPLFVLLLVLVHVVTPNRSRRIPRDSEYKTHPTLSQPCHY